MRIDILTLFPQLCECFLNESIIGRARAKGVAEFFCHNIRDYTESRQGRVDDAPFGGGTGLIMQIQPILSCHKAVSAMADSPAHVVYMSPQGKPLTQARVCELSQLERVEILCGHYEGVDERVLELIVDEEISVGDFVVTGGELPALMLADAITRMLPGTLRNEEAYSLESHYNGLLEYPQYTRPWDWQGMTPPEVLRSGHHANIRAWQQEESLRRTAEKRPDLPERSQRPCAADC
ncbi:MAG: tRNA (guanosine(37)-N1)-methyltransferase TrmD [Oscillospiraceae bacterium]|jgi:tRNA (guanine37-N1)-methyltransferase|nr:tRNA (guanosine(37)-N1)-methyltransferase TrmD [Oscillospiraceae bacterium]